MYTSTRRWHGERPRPSYLCGQIRSSALLGGRAHALELVIFFVRSIVKRTFYPFFSRLVQVPEGRYHGISRASRRPRAVFVQR